MSTDYTHMTTTEVLADIARNIEQLVSDDGFLSEIAGALSLIANTLGATGTKIAEERDDGHLKQLVLAIERHAKQLQAVL